MRVAGLIFALLLVDAAAGSSASASSLYYEIDGGMTQFRGADTFYVGNPATSGYGFGLNLAFFYALSDASLPVELHFGLKTHYDVASSGSSSYSLLAPYPMLRVQVMFLYASAGVTPLAWTGSVSSPQRASITYAAQADAGALWAVTPQFSLGLELDSQWVNANSTLSGPFLEGMLIMRFYFASFGGQGGGGRNGMESGEFKGWRYPFGFYRGP